MGPAVLQALRVARAALRVALVEPQALRVVLVELQAEQSAAVDSSRAEPLPVAPCWSPPPPRKLQRAPRRPASRLHSLQHRLSRRTRTKRAKAIFTIDGG